MNQAMRDLVFGCGSVARFSEHTADLWNIFWVRGTVPSRYRFVVHSVVFKCITKNRSHYTRGLVPHCLGFPKASLESHSSYVFNWEVFRGLHFGVIQLFIFFFSFSNVTFVRWMCDICISDYHAMALAIGRCMHVILCAMTVSYRFTQSHGQ